MNKNTKIIEVGDITAPLRLDVYLVGALKCTRNHARRLIDGGLVFVNENAAKQNKIIKNGDKISLELLPPEGLEIAPENIPLDIVYQDSSLAVVNKPQNMTVHPSGKTVSGTLVNALLFHIKDLSGINGKLRPGIVHRLDKDTSGLLVVAKDDFAHAHLSGQLKDKTCKRFYKAVCEGVFKEDEGVVDTCLSRDKLDRKKIAVSDSGRRAVSKFRVLERFSNYTLVEFELFTGRTHQIRVHARHINHPVVGDLTYGYAHQKFNLDGQLLHAYKLGFRHPRTDEVVCFEAPLPDYFETVLKILRQKNT
jgi:23S rRNA pseudouridine1911/1915/1917 synthase